MAVRRTCTYGYVSVLQSGPGLGIMIIEGKHAEVGQGIFISDIQEGSAAEQVCSEYCFSKINLPFIRIRVESLILL